MTWRSPILAGRKIYIKQDVIIMKLVASNIHSSIFTHGVAGYILMELFLPRLRTLDVDPQTLKERAAQRNRFPNQFQRDPRQPHYTDWIYIVTNQ